MQSTYQCFYASKWETRYKKGLNTYIIADFSINKNYVSYTNNNIRPIVYNKKLIRIAEKVGPIPISSNYFHSHIYVGEST